MIGPAQAQLATPGCVWRRILPIRRIATRAAIGDDILHAS
jgi:hypothetical protein